MIEIKMNELVAFMIRTTRHGVGTHNGINRVNKHNIAAIIAGSNGNHKFSPTTNRPSISGKNYPL